MTYLVSDLLYRPDGLENHLPMFLASGVVTELAPLLAHLKFDYMDNRYVIEEPDMWISPSGGRECTHRKACTRVLGLGFI